MWLAIFFSAVSLAGDADKSIRIKVEPGVVAVDLTCGAQTHRSAVQGGWATFDATAERCQVSTVRKLGTLDGSGLWDCTGGGCSQVTPPIEGGNAASCRKYVENYNGLECITDPMNLDQEALCASLDLSPVDMTAYWTCMVDKLGCKTISGHLIPDIANQEDCPILLRP